MGDPGAGPQPEHQKLGKTCDGSIDKYVLMRKNPNVGENFCRVEEIFCKVEQFGRCQRNGADVFGGQSLGSESKRFLIGFVQGGVSAVVADSQPIGVPSTLKPNRSCPADRR